MERLERFREGKPLPDGEIVQPPSHQEDDDAKSDTKSEERNIQGDVLPDEGAADQVVQDCTQQPVQATSTHTTKPGKLEPEKKGYNLVGLVWWWRRMKKIEMTWERNVVKRRNEIVSRATFFKKFKTSVDCNQGGSMGKSDGSSESPLKTLAAKLKLVQENSLTQLEYQSPFFL